MNDTDVIALSVTMMVSMITGLWSRRVKRKPVVKTYSCHHQEEVEFSGGGATVMPPERPRSVATS